MLKTPKWAQWSVIWKSDELGDIYAKNSNILGDIYVNILEKQHRSNFCVI